MEKKTILTIFALTKMPILVYLIIIIATVPAINAINYDYILGAHRGDSIKYTENTLEAIQSALEKQEYAFIEFDIQYTKDSQIVVFHDGTLLRMQGTNYSICDLTYEELQNMTDFKIPLYSEVMDIIQDNKKINIEIKACKDPEKNKELIDFIIKDAKQRDILENIMVSSISSEVIEYSKEKYPDIKTGKIFWVLPSTFLHFSFLTEQLYEEMDEIKADYIMLHGSNIHNIDNLIELKPEDKTLVFWYFDDQMYIIQKDKNDGIW